MAQANVSRAKAVRALKDNHSDIVNAIMVSKLALFFSPDVPREVLHKRPSANMTLLLQELTM